MQAKYDDAAFTFFALAMLSIYVIVATWLTIKHIRAHNVKSKNTGSGVRGLGTGAGSVSCLALARRLLGRMCAMPLAVAPR